VGTGGHLQLPEGGGVWLPNSTHVADASTEVDADFKGHARRTPSGGASFPKEANTPKGLGSRIVPAPSLRTEVPALGMSTPRVAGLQQTVHPEPWWGSSMPCLCGPGRQRSIGIGKPVPDGSSSFLDSAREAAVACVSTKPKPSTELLPVDPAIQRVGHPRFFLASAGRAGHPQGNPGSY